MVDTDSKPRPGDFPTGSVESRAAARTMISSTNASPPGSLSEAADRCGKCCMSGLPWEQPETPDAHYDPITRSYKYLDYAPAAHAALGLSMGATNNER